MTSNREVWMSPKKLEGQENDDHQISYCTYDEDWQRRKSVLIRSLFHDIPILSPVEEESNDSSHDYYVPTQEVFPSPPRPYSPLPPLIIEKIPIINKHDEPEEYYRKLHKKIKKIYEKLFLEKRNVSSVDFGSNYNDSSVNDESEYNTQGSVENLVNETDNNSPENSSSESITEDREASTREQSAASTKSNGYGADFESMDTAVIDVVNHTLSNEDIIMISEEEESENENVDEDGIRYEDFGNCRSSENKESGTERMDDEVFSRKQVSHHSTVNDQDTTETEESDKTEIEHNYDADGSDSEIIDEHEMIEETRQTNTLVKVGLEVNRGTHHSIIDDQEINKSSKSNEEDADRNSNNQESKWKQFEAGFGGRNELIESNDEPMEADVETSQSSDGPHYRQITTEALIHFDGFQIPGERESIVYEDSVRSIILPTRYRRMLASRNVDLEDRIEVYTGLEENADPKIASIFNIYQNETTEEDHEEMATSHPDTTFENDEEMSTHHPDALEEDDEEMSAALSDARGRNFEEIGTCQPGAIEEDDEEISARQSDHSEEIDTNHTDSANKEIEERRDFDSHDTDKKNEAWHQPNDAGEDIREMRTPGLDTIEEDDEEMSIHQAEEDLEVDIEQTRTLPQDDSDKNTEEISVYQLVSDEDTEAKRSSPRIDECDITQRDRTIDATFEKETAHPNITDKEVRTRTPGTNEEDMRTTQTEVTGEEIEKMRTPQPKATKKQMKIPVPESTAIERKIHQPAASDDEEMDSPHSIELMRTPRKDLSHGTIPITQQNYSASSSEHSALPQELTALSSSIQYGADNIMSDLQISNDMNDILTSIFQESRSQDGTPISRRKRKLVDKSVQAVETKRVTWDEMRANFFIGTPKIFRLCACTDHICS